MTVLRQGLDVRGKRQSFNLTAMNKNELNQIAKATQLAGLYNMVANLLWTILSLLPVTIFCYSRLTINFLFLFVGISILPVFLSNAIIDKMQVAKRAASYKKLGVGVVQQLSQNGQIIKSIIRRRYPAYQVLRRDQKSIKALLLQTYVFEKFHLALFVFFCLISYYAFSKGLANWSAVFFLLNVLYNVYPILLQQFIRVKLSLYVGKNKTNMPAANTGYSKYKLKCMG
jgi:hypothetical protein